MTEFFKINKTKIWISVLIIIISLISFYMALKNQCSDSCPTDYSQAILIIISVIIAGLPIFLISLLYDTFNLHRSNFMDLIFLIGGIIVSIFYVYFISCLIVKMKKRWWILLIVIVIISLLAYYFIKIKLGTPVYNSINPNIKEQISRLVLNKSNN